MGPKGYEPFLQKIAQQGLITGDTCREVYENWEGPESQDNKIRLQIGVGQ